MSHGSIFTSIAVIVLMVGGIVASVVLESALVMTLFIVTLMAWLLRLVVLLRYERE